ncbi:hypothetical protein ECOG_01725 [Escherichia coli H299]|nr:hypothetical protein ECOG_01725 [Escherichia coli H299]
MAPDLLYRLNGWKKIGKKLSALAALHWSRAMTKNAW